MNSTRLEPGLLTIFRLFLIVQFVLIVVGSMVHHVRGYVEINPAIAIAVAGAFLAILFGYLSWPWLHKKLGQAYLPIALIFEVVFSLVAQNLFLTHPLSFSDTGSEESAWLLFLYVPLILIGWQYSFKPVVVYCLLTTFLDFILIRFVNPDYFTFRQTFHRLLFTRFLSLLLVGYIISRIMQQLRLERRALQEANQKLEHYVAALEQLTVSRERNRLARELHDTLAHTLSGVAVQLEAVDSLWASDRKQARQILGHSLRATRDGLTETRKAITSLRATPLEDLGLCRALRDYAEATAARAGFHLEMDLPSRLDGLPPEIEQCFYRVGQEALENAARHAQATSVRVSLTGSSRELQIEIYDDGIGFDPQVASSGSRFGLQGMRERAGVIHATLEIASRPGEGACIRLLWQEEGTA